eukprot:1144307-Pelagomonas_calceolata.AAC.6
MAYRGTNTSKWVNTYWQQQHADMYKYKTHTPYSSPLSHVGVLLDGRAEMNEKGGLMLTRSADQTWQTSSSGLQHAYGATPVRSHKKQAGGAGRPAGGSTMLFYAPQHAVMQDRLECMDLGAAGFRKCSVASSRTKPNSRKGKAQEARQALWLNVQSTSSERIGFLAPEKHHAGGAIPPTPTSTPTGHAGQPQCADMGSAFAGLYKLMKEVLQMVRRIFAKPEHTYNSSVDPRRLQSKRMQTGSPDWLLYAIETCDARLKQ